MQLDGHKMKLNRLEMNGRLSQKGYSWAITCFSWKIRTFCLNISSKKFTKSDMHYKVKGKFVPNTSHQEKIMLFVLLSHEIIDRSSTSMKSLKTRFVWNQISKIQLRFLISNFSQLAMCII